MFLFSTHGRTTLRTETLSLVVTELAAAMVKAKESREPFQLRDIRRTAETMLASMGISRDVRAQLLSHGIGGVQAAHYDRHDYMAEKTAALKAWEQRLSDITEGKKTAPNVVPLHRTAGRT